MNCPSCNNTLFKQFDNVKNNSSYCEYCGGVWIDADDLFNYIKNFDHKLNNYNYRIFIDNVLKTDNNCYFEEKKYCQKCNGLCMDKIEYNNSGVIVDVCTNCKGVFFDKNELNHVLLFLSKTIDNKEFEKIQIETKEKNFLFLIASFFKALFKQI